MRITTFAAIYIGSFEVSMKVFELAPRKNLREIDFIRARIELGKDSYKKGYIGSERMEQLGDVLAEYKKIMESYRVTAYEAYAGGVIRDAKNQEFIVDQIRIRTGIEIKVLSNSEHRFISFQAVCNRMEFAEMTKEGTAVVDVGGGSLQITVFENGRAVTTQHLALGTMRIREKLENLGGTTGHFETLIEEVVDKELGTMKYMYLDQVGIKYLVFMGDYIVDFAKKIQQKQDGQVIHAEKFVKSLNKYYRKNVEQINAELGLIDEHDTLVVPYLVLYRRMAETLGAEEIWVPGVSISDGIAYNYALKKGLVKSQHDVEADIIEAAKNIAARYESDSPHIEALGEMAVLVFDTMKKLHGMGRRERLLLQVAAITHDTGKFISLAHGSECAYQIILNTEIIGLTHLEREMIACTVLYNTYPLPEFMELADRMDQQSYMTVAKLSAMLRVANAMDRSHKQKFKNVKATMKDKTLVITIETTDNIALEKGLFDAKAEFFERIFGVKPVIKEKRIYE